MKLGACIPPAEVILTFQADTGVRWQVATSLYMEAKVVNERRNRGQELVHRELTKLGKEAQ